MKIRDIIKFGKAPEAGTSSSGVNLTDISQVSQENPHNLQGLYIQEFFNLSKDNLFFYLESARKGVNFWKSLLFEEIRRSDSEIGGVCQTRKSSVANKEYEIKFPDRSKIADAYKESIIDFLNEMFEDDKLNVQNFFGDVLEAQIQGVSTFEVFFGLDAGKYVIRKLKYIQNHLLCYDDLADEYRYLLPEASDAMQLRFKGMNLWEDRINLDGMCIERIDKRKIIEVHSLDGNAQNGFQNGCIDSLIWAFLWKHYGLSDWSTYVERFATPAIVAKYPALMGKDDKRILKEAVEKYGKLFKLIIPIGAEIAQLGDTQKSQTTELFKQYTDYWDSRINIRVLGQTLTTNVGDKGSYALGKVHNAVREDLAVLDMMLVKVTMNELIRRVIDLNFAGVDKYPVFSFKQEKDIEYKKSRSEIFKNLAASGWRVTQEDVENEFDISVEPAVNAAPLQQQGGYINKFINEFFENEK